MVLTHPGRAGQIRGRIVSERTQVSQTSIISRSIIQKYAERRPSHPESARGVGNEVTAVVYLVGAMDLSGHNDTRTAVMDQRDEEFVPHVLPIVVGSTVRFLNSDDVYHNVFSLAPARTFDLGRYPTGQFRDVVFDTPGVVSVYCDIHTQMNAFILVLPNPYFAVTDTEGRFRIDDVPAGTYELRVWYGRWPEKSQRVTVNESEPVEVHFVFP